MSHDGTWRASCDFTHRSPSFHFENTVHRTRRDKSRRWLWRLVRRLGSCSASNRRAVCAPWSVVNIAKACCAAAGSPRRRISSIAVFIIDLRCARGKRSTATSRALKAASSCAAIISDASVSDPPCSFAENRFKSVASVWCISLPNVKDEPRPSLARLVQE
jgi:hypothetical protein